MGKWQAKKDAWEWDAHKRYQQNQDEHNAYSSQASENSDNASTNTCTSTVSARIPEDTIMTPTQRLTESVPQFKKGDWVERINGEYIGYRGKIIEVLEQDAKIRVQWHMNGIKELTDKPIKKYKQGTEDLRKINPPLYKQCAQVGDKVMGTGGGVGLITCHHLIGHKDREVEIKWETDDESDDDEDDSAYFCSHHDTSFTVLPQFTEGEWLRCIDGPFKGMYGTVKEVLEEDGIEKVRVEWRHYKKIPFGVIKKSGKALPIRKYKQWSKCLRRVPDPSERRAGRRRLGDESRSSGKRPIHDLWDQVLATGYVPKPKLSYTVY